MSAILENKWDISYIQTLPAEIQQKVLQKILENVFITNKCTQHKTLDTLKIMHSNYQDNKKVGKLFSKFELFFPGSS